MLFCFRSHDFWMHSFQQGKTTVVDCKTATEVVGIFGGKGRVGFKKLVAVFKN